MLHFVSLVLSLFLFSSANAAWQLDNDRSTLSFVSRKKTHVAEVGTFRQLSGQLADDGRLNVAIALDSVATNIPIRDERMREHLFATQEPGFATATLSGQVDPEFFTRLSTTPILAAAVEAELTLHGHKVPLTIQFVVTQTAPDTLFVAAQQPLVLQTERFGLLTGIETLRELAGLPSISHTVPVSFVLTFVRERQ